MSTSDIIEVLIEFDILMFLCGNKSVVGWLIDKFAR